MKSLKIIIIFILVFILIVFYFAHTIMPTYNGEVTIDLNNSTMQSLNNISITYKDSEYIVEVPEIKPFERVILVLPNSIFNKPIKSQIYINYNEQKYTLLEEYYNVSFSKNNRDVKQCAKAIIKGNNVVVKDLYGFINFDYYVNFKPYFRIIHLEI